MTPEEQRLADIEMVKAHCIQLGDHFETVQIFVSRHMPAETDGTRTIADGTGNWYARYGQVAHWKIECDERTKIIEQQDAEDEE